MSDVVHQDGCLYGFRFRIEDELSFLLKRQDGLAHQVEGSQRVLEARVTGTRIDHRGQSQLVDTVKALEKRVLHNVVEQTLRYADESKDRIVDNGNVAHLFNSSILQFFKLYH